VWTFLWSLPQHFGIRIFVSKWCQESTINGWFVTSGTPCIQSWLGYLVRARDHYYWQNYPERRILCKLWVGKEKKRKKNAYKMVRKERHSRPGQEIINGSSSTGISRQGRGETPSFLWRRSIKASSSPRADGLVSIVHLPSRDYLIFHHPKYPKVFTLPLRSNRSDKARDVSSNFWNLLIPRSRFLRRSLKISFCFVNCIIYIYIYIYIYIHIYTGCFILIAPGKYLEKYGNYEKMFRTKVLWFRGHLKFLKWNLLFVITYSCSLSPELSKTL